MKIHKLNCVLVVSIALISNFIIDVFAMSIEQLQQQYANSVLQAAQQRVAALAWGSGSSVAVGEINRIISDSNKAISEKKRKELLQIVDRVVAELAAEFRKDIESRLPMELAMLHEDFEADVLKYKKEKPTLMVELDIKFRTKKLTEDLTKKTEEIQKKAVDFERKCFTGLPKLLKRLCNEIEIPYMQVFLEKLPIIVREYCAWHKPPVKWENRHRDAHVVELLQTAIEKQNDPTALERIVRQLIPMITIGIIENTDNIFDCYAAGDGVRIKLTAHKDEKHLIDEYARDIAEAYFFAQQRPALAQELAAQYKFHLMPQEGFEVHVFGELARLIKNDPLLQQYIDMFKIKPESYETLKDGNVPKIVIYVNKGKIAAQYVLNKLYEHFKNYKGHSEYQPRYNQKVTDFLYFAQGDGDVKKLEHFKEYFEEGVGAPAHTGRIYLRPDFTPEGANGGYHLTLPH